MRERDKREVSTLKDAVVGFIFGESEEVGVTAKGLSDVTAQAGMTTFPATLCQTLRGLEGSIC